MINGGNLFSHFKAGNAAEVHSTVRNIAQAAITEPKLLYSPLAKNQFTLDFEKMASLLLQGHPVNYRLMAGEYIAEFTIEGKKEYYNLSQIIKFSNRHHVSMEGPEIAAYEQRAENYLHEVGEHEGPKIPPTGSQDSQGSQGSQVSQVSQRSQDPSKPKFFKGMLVPTRESMKSMAAKDLQTLSYAELLAMRNWTSPYYSSINKFLKGQLEGMSGPEISQACIHTAMALSGLNKAPKKRLGDTTENPSAKGYLFRWEFLGTGSPDKLERLKKRVLNLQQNEVVINEPCLISTSFDKPPERLEGDIAVIFEGECLGVDLRTISDVPDEREALIPPTQLKIVGYLFKDGVNYFIIRMVDTPSNQPEEALAAAKNIHQNDLMRARFGMQQLLEKFIALEKEQSFVEHLSHSPELYLAFANLAVLAKNMLQDAAMEPSKKLAALHAQVDAIDKIFVGLVEKDKTATNKKGYVISKFNKIFKEHQNEEALLEIEKTDEKFKEKQKQAKLKQAKQNDEILIKLIDQLSYFPGTLHPLSVDQIKERMPQNTMMIVQKEDGFILLQKDSQTSKEHPISIVDGKFKAANIAVPIENLFGIDDALQAYAAQKNAKLINIAAYRYTDPDAVIIEPDAPDVPVGHKASQKEGVLPLARAITDNNVEAVTNLVLIGADAGIEDDNGNTLLMNIFTKILDNDKPQINNAAKRLLEICPSEVFLKRNQEGEHMLFMMAAKGLDDALPLLERKTIEQAINDKNENGDTPLLYAILFGNKNIAERLMTHGADLNYVIGRQTKDLKEYMENLPGGMDKLLEDLEKKIEGAYDKKTVSHGLKMLNEAIGSITANPMLSNKEILEQLTKILHTFKLLLINKYPVSETIIKNSFSSYENELSTVKTVVDTTEELQAKHHAAKPLLFSSKLTGSVIEEAALDNKERLDDKTKKNTSTTPHTPQAPPGV